jgi:DNA-binding NtrC family response regulator
MKRILVVDDDEQIVRAVRKILTREGYEITVAGDGVDALNKLQNESYDMVITDIIMPNKEGLELISEIYQIKASMPIIAISGGGKMPSSIYLDVADKIGAYATLRKPFRADELLTVVNQCFSK